MDIKKLQAVVIDALEDIKAQDIKVFDTAHLTSLFERVAIASGTSNRQTRALAASVRDKVKEAGGHVVGVEGEDTGEWVLVDLGDMLVHIMQAPIRAYYRLEEIWGEKEVKLGAAKRTSKKTAEGEAPVRKVSRHLAVQQAAAEEEVKPKRSRKKAEEAALEEAPVAKKPRVRKAAAEQEAVADAPKPRSRARKPAEDGAAPAPKIATGKKVKVAPAKAVVAELKEVKEAKAKERKRASDAAAAPVKRVLKRVKAKEE